MSKIIQVLKPYYRVEETLDEIKECLEKGWTGMGYKTEEIEKQWKIFSGFSFAHFLNSATSGLHLALKLFKEKYKWQDGDEIITSSLTFVSANHAILYESLAPVFADVDESLCLNPDSVEKLITKKTKAIVFVGIGGNAAHYHEVQSLCKKHNLVFILDAAHMSGTRWSNSHDHVGVDSDCAVFSFQAVKNCPSADAGMICFNDESMDKLARTYSWLGIDKSTYARYSESSYKWKYDVNHLGYKYHGNSVMASMCLVSLKYLEQDNAYRRNLADLYDKYLSKISHIKIIKHDSLIQSSRHLYQIMSESRDQVMEKLANHQIFCGVHYIANTTYSIYSNFKKDVKNAENFSGKLISLPLHLELHEADICHIAEIIQK